MTPKTEVTNRQFRLASRPDGRVSPENWSLSEAQVPAPADGEFLVRNLYISVDPAMRRWITDRRSYIAPVEVGDVMRALGAGRVVESCHPKFQPGDHVVGLFGVQDFALSTGDGVVKVDTSVTALPVYLGALGMTGMTAYFGLLEIGQPQPGDTVVVSAAAGAVGSVAGQIAKIKGCRVVGIAGGGEKCRFVVDELGFDAAIDYRSEKVSDSLKEHCPDGIDVYFDNVGGEILEAVLARIARGARIVLSGAISQYNAEGPMRGPSNYMSLLVNRARMEGFVVFDFAARYPEAAREMAGWMAEGKLKSREHIVEGFESFPDALTKLFTGENIGKLVLKVAEA